MRLKLDCNEFEELVRGKKMESEGRLDRLLFWNGIIDWEEVESKQNFHINWKEERGEGYIYCGHTQ